MTPRLVEITGLARGLEHGGRDSRLSRVAACVKIRGISHLSWIGHKITLVA